MSNTVITNYTDLNGPSTKADSSVVVIVNKDGSLSVDENLLGTLMGSDGSQAAGISVVRVGHEGRPDDATDSESDDDQVPHVTLSVDSYFDDPNSIIKYDSGAEMLQSFRIETRENSLLGFQNDHCYTLLMSPDGASQQKSDGYTGYDEPVIEISQQPPPKPVPHSKKITILDQKIIPKGRRLPVNASEAFMLKGNEALHKQLGRSKIESRSDKILAELKKDDENTESSSISSSGDSVQDRDSDSDYNYVREKPSSARKSKLKPKILKTTPKGSKLEPRVAARLKTNKNILKKDVKEKMLLKNVMGKQIESKGNSAVTPAVEQKKETPKQIVKQGKKEKKTPAHVNALLTDMTSLFSTPDVIRRISTENKVSNKDSTGHKKVDDVKDRIQKSVKQKGLLEKAKGYDLIPQIDDASLAQILQDTSAAKTPVTTASSMNSPGLGPLSPTLDLLGGLQPEEEGLTEDLLMHVAQLVESSENLQEVIDKQVLGKVDTPKAVPTAYPQGADSMYTPKSAKTALPRKDPIEIVRRDGRVITLPPIEAPATRASKRKSQLESASAPDAAPPAPAPAPAPPAAPAPPPAPPRAPAVDVAQRDFEAELELSTHVIAKQYVNKKAPKKPEVEPAPAPAVDKASAESSQESWNSEDDPNRLWCICRQPHNNRFMICCDGCEDWFHGKCVNITKQMGQQMEERGVEWRCPNCVKKVARPKTMQQKLTPFVKKRDSVGEASPSPKQGEAKTPGRSVCIVCKKAARPSSIYCSDTCILKHAQDSLAPQEPAKTGDGGKPAEKGKLESRVIVYERKTGRCLAGPNAPTAENLKAWLQKNPTFEVVRPGSINAIKPKKPTEPGKVQTTLNFDRTPKRVPIGQSALTKPGTPAKESPKVTTPVREEAKPQPKTPVTPKNSQKMGFFDTPRASTSTAKPSPSEVRKPTRPPPSRQQPSTSKASASPAASRRKDTPDNRSRMGAVEPIRENVRKALQEHLSLRMAETSGPKFSTEDIQLFATETEAELYDLFKDVGVKYKAKYRSLMFNIKDRKNLTLWDKICDKSITPSQLVRLSAEELASQELAQWRDQEAKHQLELIKKSELDLLAASKTYVLKTHKGEEVMETKESVSTELDPNVAVEDLVSALNDSSGVEAAPDSTDAETSRSLRKLSADSTDKQSASSKKKKEESDSRRRSTRDSKRDSDRRRRRSPSRTRDDKSRRSDKKSKRPPSKDRKKEEKVDSSERSSRSKSSRSSKSHSRSQERERSRSRGRSKRESRDSRGSRRNRSKSRPSTEEAKPRSRSQDAAQAKGKNDSTDSETMERPKSAMMKESHPEYDPHEPMITSAFSDEDLKKSREDVYGDSLNIDESLLGPAEFDHVKSFSLDTTTKSPPKTPKASRRKRDKLSEAESDQEPSSTVESAAATVWNGCINMVDVARFYVAAHEVSGCGAELEEELSAELDVVGRINPDTVWEYINKMRRSPTRDTVLLRLAAANDEERMQYIALYSYLSTRNRLGVIKVSNATTVKDFYILPLAASASLPPALLPLDGPGLEDNRNHLLIGIIVRQRKQNKRPAPATAPRDAVPAKMTRSARTRSFTPPAPPSAMGLPLPGPPYASQALSSTVKDKIAASLAAEDNEPYDPGAGVTGAGVTGAGVTGARPHSDRLRTKMEELNRQIEEQKQQIRNMTQAPPTAHDEDEAYSPSRPMTPPAAAAPSVPLADISLPSNLQEMLATIKQRSADVDMRPT